MPPRVHMVHCPGFGIKLGCDLLVASGLGSTLIEMLLAHADLAHIRFAYSPARELMASLRTLHDPQRKHVYRGWRAAVSGSLSGLDMDLLTALAPTGPHVFTFLMPIPAGPSAVLAEELDAVVATSASAVRTELDYAAQGKPIAGPLRRLYEDPAAQLPAVVDEMHKYWTAAVEPFWGRLQSLAAADLSFRLEQFAREGIAGVLENLHPGIRLNHDRLHIAQPHQCRHQHDLTSSGILLLPCVFTWPTLLVGCCSTDQPTLTYPARAVATLMDGQKPGQSDPLWALVGRSRATLLAQLDLPMTTTDLAKRLDITAAAVSQHLRVLKAAGLVSAWRRGRSVYYQRTAAATSLLSTTKSRVALHVGSA